MKKIKNCNYCEKPISSGRSDKKYCSNTCRYANKNERHRERPQEIILKEHVKGLKLNRELLDKYHIEEWVDKEVLLMQGFNWAHFDFHLTLDDEQYYCCLDYCYRTDIDSDQIQIINKKDIL